MAMERPRNDGEPHGWTREEAVEHIVATNERADPHVLFHAFNVMVQQEILDVEEIVANVSIRYSCQSWNEGLPKHILKAITKIKRALQRERTDGLAVSGWSREETISYIVQRNPIADVNILLDVFAELLEQQIIYVSVHHKGTTYYLNNY